MTCSKISRVLYTIPYILYPNKENNTLFPLLQFQHFSKARIKCLIEIFFCSQQQLIYLGTQSSFIMRVGLVSFERKACRCTNIILAAAASRRKLRQTERRGVDTTLLAGTTGAYTVSHVTSALLSFVENGQSSL